MDYFSYLSFTKQKDNKETFIKYLIEVMEYKEKEAIKEASIYYKEA